MAKGLEKNNFGAHSHNVRPIYEMVFHISTLTGRSMRYLQASSVLPLLHSLFIFFYLLLLRRKSYMLESCSFFSLFIKLYSQICLYSGNCSSGDKTALYRFGHLRKCFQPMEQCLLGIGLSIVS